LSLLPGGHLESASDKHVWQDLPRDGDLEGSHGSPWTSLKER